MSIGVSKLKKVFRNSAVALAMALALPVAVAATSRTHADEAVERGKYLVGLMGCNDCHTPGHFFGKPDMSRMLSGSEVAFEVPGLGAFVGPNLTPDEKTGLGAWSEEEIVTALQTGIRPDGRELAPAMPWRAFASMTRADATAIARYLKSLPAVDNQVPGPFAPGETATSFVFRVLPPGEAVANLH